MWPFQRQSVILTSLADFRRELSAHSASTEVRHGENTRSLSEISGKVSGLQNQVSVLDSRVAALDGRVGGLESLKPDLENGIKLEQERISRRRLVKRVAQAIIATLLFVAAMIPLLTVLTEIRITIGDH